MKKWLVLLTLIASIGTAFLFKDSINRQAPALVSSPKHIFSEFQNFKLGQGIDYQDRPEFNPEIDQNFGILIWLKFKAITNIDQRIFILRKYKGESDTGYALAFNQFNDGFYPQVFWPTKADSNWLTFQKFKPVQNRWYGFLLTFTDNKYLGLQILKPNKARPGITLENLGGYILKDSLPVNSAKLEIGSIGTHIFNGSIAKISFFKSPTKDFKLIDLIDALKTSSPATSLKDYHSFDIELKSLSKKKKRSNPLIQ